MKLTIKLGKLHLEPENAAERCQVDSLAKDLIAQSIDFESHKNWSEIMDIRIPLKIAIRPIDNMATRSRSENGPRLNSKI